MLYIDRKYTSLVGSSLRNFKRKNTDLWNFSCPYCGDSQKNKLKARGYVYVVKGSLLYKCHNCGVGTTLANLIKHVNPSLHKEYVMENFKSSDNKAPTAELKFEPPKFEKKDIFSKLKSIEALGHYHPAYEYCAARKMPKSRYKDLYLANKFYEFVNTVEPGKFKKVLGDHPRLIIPFKDRDGAVIGFQGRSFGNEKPKYVTIIVDKSKPKIYGLDHLNDNGDVYVVEGPIDSMFLNNGLAVMQSDLRIPSLKDRVVLVPDNEPRNREVMAQLKRVIKEGYKVVVWPDNIEEKDINEMVINNKDVVAIIYNNTYKGLQAEMRFSEWNKMGY